MTTQKIIALFLATTVGTTFLSARSWPKRHQIDTYSITIFAVDQEDKGKVCAHKTFEAPTYRQVADKVESFVTTLCADKENVSITLSCKALTTDDTWIERNYSRTMTWCKNDSEYPLSDRQYTVKTKRSQKKLNTLITDLCTKHTLFDQGPVFNAFAFIIGLPLLIFTAGIIFIAAVWTNIVFAPLLIPVVYVGVPAFVVYEVGTSPFIYDYFYEPVWQRRSTMVMVC